MEFHRVYHLLNEFCNSELSAFYLDVLKDRLYTYPAKFKAGNEYQRDLFIARRSAQTAIYKITDALARLTAPILSFTADEVWQNIPGKQGSVHLQLFPKPEHLTPADTRSLLQDWEQLLTLRQDVLKELEAARQAKRIGKSLEAAVTIFEGPSDVLMRYEQRFPGALEEMLNVSKVNLVPVTGVVNVGPDHLAVNSTSGEGAKCERCWRQVPDVGHNAAYPTVCARCSEALDAIDFAPYSASTNN